MEMAIFSEKSALWQKVIKDFYGDDDGFNSHPIFKRYHGAWSDIIKAVSHIEEVDPSFRSSFKLKVSVGSNTLFWKDTWTSDGQPLKDIYPRLFALDNDPNCVISDSWGLVNDIWCGL
ncbi:hypothetical protein Tco_1339223 [Tanacetum coccineum]